MNRFNSCRLLPPAYMLNSIAMPMAVLPTGQKGTYYIRWMTFLDRDWNQKISNDPFKLWEVALEAYDKDQEEREAHR